MNTPWCRRLSRPMVAAALLVTVAACGGSGPAATVTASPGPAGATESPRPAPTLVITPTPASPSSAAPAPAAPSELTWAIPCQETYTCTGAGSDPILATWTPSDGPVDGYRLYFTAGHADMCAVTWTANGTATLLGSLGSTTHSWSGRAPSLGGKLSIVAFNHSGESTATFSSPVDPTEPMCP
jgi:hypothetical protein